MQTYKAPDNSLHCIDPQHEYMLPLGSVPISDEDAEALRRPSHAQLVAQTLGRTREDRQPILGVLDGMQSSALTKGDGPAAMAIEAVKQGLKDITKTDLTGCTTADAMRAKIMTSYASLVTANPAVATAFKGVLA